jgi:hypothetical protein
MDLRETACDGMDWVYLAQDRDQRLALVNMVLNFQVPQNGGGVVEQVTGWRLLKYDSVLCNY